MGAGSALDRFARAEWMRATAAFTDRPVVVRNVLLGKKNHIIRYRVEALDDLKTNGFRFTDRCRQSESTSRQSHERQDHQGHDCVVDKKKREEQLNESIQLWVTPGTGLSLEEHAEPDVISYSNSAHEKSRT